MFGNKKCTKIHFFANKFAYIKKKQYFCRPKWKKGINYTKDMTRTTFNRLRDVKDSLPHGSMAVIASELGVTADEVRAFFNGEGTPESGYHIEPGPDGGIVVLNDTRILEVALRIAWESRNAI